MRFLLRLAGGIDRLNMWIGKAVYWLALLMILFGVYNATVRYLGSFIGQNLSSNAYLEAQWYLFGIIFLLGAAYTLRTDGHVRVDVLYGRLSPRGQAWVDLAGSILFLVPFCFIVLWLSVQWAAFSWQTLETSGNPGGLPRYPIKTVVPVAFALLLLQGVSQAIKSAAVLTGDRRPDADGGGEGFGKVDTP
ncbi:TRAP transporter small permease subunit [Arhodomonas sp. SL1]|uniref:TRAP transporter small permease subunit n=1 Tax=Arhodomonas sp. SL1 TaxID=3425691 RepID=UPI003F880700